MEGIGGIRLKINKVQSVRRRVGTAGHTHGYVLSLFSPLSLHNSVLRIKGHAGGQGGSLGRLSSAGGRVCSAGNT